MQVITRTILCLAALLVAQALASAQSASPQEPTGMIAGRVTIAGKPAANMRVALMSDRQGGARVALAVNSTTDAEGRFQLTGLPAGRFYVMAFAPAFYSEGDSGRYNGGKTVTLVEGESVDDLTLALRRGGVITGRITGATGRPLIQEGLHLYRRNPQSGQLEEREYGYRNMRTDDRGVYRIYGLPPGRYVVSAGTPVRDDSVRMSQGSSYYTQTFYPGVSDEAKAADIEVTEGGEATNIDIALGRAEKTYSVRLRIVAAETGKPIAGMRCGYGHIDPENKYMRDSAIGAESNPKGECLIEGVLPGKYVALVMPSNDAGQNYTYDPASFEITDTDVQDIELKLRQGASISGTISLEGVSSQEAATYLRDLFIGVSVPTSIGMPRFSRPQINTDGSFRINSLPPGKARIVINGYPRRNMTLLRVERDGVDQTEGLDLAAGESITGVRLTVGVGTGVIRGELKIAGGNLPAGTRFLVRARRVGDTNPQNQYHAECDMRGRFVFEGMVPGDYEINAGNSFINEGEAAAPVRFKPFSKTVTVTGESEAQVTLILERETGNNQ